MKNIIKAWLKSLTGRVDRLEYRVKDLDNGLTSDIQRLLDSVDKLNAQNVGMIDTNQDLLDRFQKLGSDVEEVQNALEAYRKNNPPANT